MKYPVLALIIFFNCSFKIPYTHDDNIIGRWIATEDKNLVVQVFKSGGEYKASIIWFDDSDDKTQPMMSRCDTKNPHKDLRKRKIIGLQVLWGLIYNENDNEWQDGHIYDPSSGNEYNAKAWLTDDGTLKVRGYWHFQIFGQNISFSRTQ